MVVLRPLTHGPSTAWSVHSSSRYTVALGSSTPARAWTPSVSSPSGEPGISTIVAAPAISAGVDRVEALGLPEPRGAVSA